METAEIYRKWLDAINSRNWEAVLQSLAPTVAVNDRKLSKKDYLQEFQNAIEAAPDKSTNIDTVIKDEELDKLAIRLVHTGSFKTPYRQLGSVAGQKMQWVEHLLCWFEDGLISRIVTIEDMESLRGNNATVSQTPNLQQRPPQNSRGLEEKYRKYIDVINSRTMAKNFPEYCQPQLAHNTRQVSLAEYIAFINDSFEAIEGLTFTIKELIVDEDAQKLAARLEFTGRPVEEFAGVKPTGKEVRFWEHAYYVFDEGKVSWVWSLLDLEAYRTALQ